MRSGGQHRFERRDGGVGHRFKARVGDPFFDVRLAVQDQRDPFALEHELDVGEGGVAVRDQIGGAH